MSTVAPIEENFFPANSTTPALRGAAPDTISLRDRKSYLLVAAEAMSPSGVRECQRLSLTRVTDQNKNNWRNDEGHGNLVTLDTHAELLRIKLGQNDNGNATIEGVKQEHDGP